MSIKWFVKLIDTHLQEAVILYYIDDRQGLRRVADRLLAAARGLCEMDAADDRRSAGGIRGD